MIDMRARERDAGRQLRFSVITTDFLWTGGAAISIDISRRVPIAGRREASPVHKFMQPKQDLLRLAKGQEHRTRPRLTRSVPPAHGRTRTDTAGAVSPSARPGPRQMDGPLSARAPGRHRRPVPRVVSPCCAVAPSRPRRPVPRARSPSAMHRLAARHRTRARPGAREPSEASVPMHVSLAAGTVSAGRLCGPCGFWIFVATSSSNIRSRARPSLREDGVQ